MAVVARIALHHL